MKMKCLIIILLALLSFTVRALAGEIVLKVGDDVSHKSVQAQGLDLFAERLEARNVGIKVEVFHARQLGKRDVQIQNVKLGIQDMIMGGFSSYEIFSQDLKIAETPFTFASRAHYEAWIRSDMFKKIHEEVIKNGNQRFVNLGVLWRRGPFRVMVCKFPVLSFEDLQRVKLRVWGTETIKRIWGKQGLGAIPVVLPFGDVYLGLRQGLVDAVTVPFDLVVPMKYGEVAKHIMDMRQFWQVVLLTINEQKWQSLTAVQQRAVLESADEGGKFFNETLEESVPKWKEELKAMGVTFHEIDRGPFVELMRKRHEEWTKEGYWRPGLIDEINALRPQ
jgi:TRAP-type C4-dicarboxylate transport system substrate-binding protein